MLSSTDVGGWAGTVIVVGDRADAVEAFVRASRALAGVAVASLEASPVEVTLAGYRILVLLSGHGPQRIGDLARDLGVHSSNATRLCDRLERRDLVARRRSETDGRAVEVSVTREGRRVVEAVTAARRDRIARILARLPDDALVGVAGAMRAFSDAAGERGEDGRRTVSRRLDAATRGRVS